MSLRHSLKAFTRYREVKRGFASKTDSSSVDSGEIRTFSNLSSKWHDEEGPFKALHSMNALRVPWILRNIAKKVGPVVDVGCGGGILSVPLARAGFTVTGLDATEEAVAAARDALESPKLQADNISERITYHHCNVEDYARQHEREFDAVVASEIVEHVANIDTFIEGCSQLAKPGAPLFFTTINKTLASRVLAIWFAENVMGIVPKGVHQWEKFVEPNHLSDVLEKNGCSVRAVSGFTYNPVTNVWHWVPITSVNYACLAVKN